ncbi:unnamed protein product [Amoebophrya sp. A25]|nr:unnamed protein product [Amoebophrya sp. A25]|eukprot:GSA25T00011330001.1
MLAQQQAETPAAVDKMDTSKFVEGAEFSRVNTMVTNTTASSSRTTLHDGLFRDITLLDGSMGRQLCEEHHLPDDALFRQIWSAAALVREEFHEKVVAVHKDYIIAGSTMLTTNSFGTQPSFYKRAYEDDYEKRMLCDAELSSKLAVQARTEMNADPSTVLILGSLASLYESHRPDCFLRGVEEDGEEVIAENYHKLAAALVRGGADYLLLETINCWEEAALALEGISRMERQVPIIIALEGAMRSLKLKPQTGRKAAHAFRSLAAYCNPDLVSPQHSASLPSSKRSSRSPSPSKGQGDSTALAAQGEEASRSASPSLSSLVESVIPSHEEQIEVFENEGLNIMDPRKSELVHRPVAQKPRLPVLCLGFNCAPPEEILDSLKAVKGDEALQQAIKSLDLRVCAYANVNDRKEAHDNGFDVRKDKREAIEKRHDLVKKIEDPTDATQTPSYAYDGYVDFVGQFIDEGADIVGGCCGCGPDGIQEIGKRLQLRPWCKH